MTADVKSGLILSSTTEYVIEIIISICKNFQKLGNDILDWLGGMA